MCPKILLSFDFFSQSLKNVNTTLILEAERTQAGGWVQPMGRCLPIAALNRSLRPEFVFGSKQGFSQEKNRNTGYPVF